MAILNMQRICLWEAGASARLADLRLRLSLQGGVVSRRGQALTKAAFGEALEPVEVVERICTDVRARGLEAVLEYTRRLDHVELTRQTVRVGPDELFEAHQSAAPAFLEALRCARRSILAFQFGVLHRSAVLTVAGSHELQLRYRPVRRVGVCVPGGAAAYPSTLLMTVCPAQAAGVKELAVVVPPTPHGGYNRDVLATCHELGVSEVYRIGGAQAVAALACGVEGIAAVDMIVGPGNLFVTLAKRHVFGQVAIDMLAGPSEIVILADDSAPPEYIAADLIAQAEHAPGACILITWHHPLVDEVSAALDRRLIGLARGQLARESLETFGALVLARGPADALNCVNEIAPEHLHLATRGPEKLLDQIENAGAVFLGHDTPVALGDYIAGPSHVLPTGGTARFASALSANDFLRRTSVMRFTPAGLRSVVREVRVLAEKEGLTAHADSVDLRLTAPTAEGLSADAGIPESRPDSFPARAR